MSQFEKLASAIADGTPIDWASAADTASSDEERETLAGLHDLALLNQLFLSADPQRRRDVLVLRPGAEWGPLRIVEHIGRGRFGEVYCARDPALDRDVALKLSADEGNARAARVIDEGRLMARVRHPNVIIVHGAMRIGGTTGLWMELVHGTTLEAELARRGPFPAHEIARIAGDLCRALGAIHRAGLVHRDVKATNVMREDGGRVVLGDFGTGRELDDPPEERAGLSGTPSYIAPEVFRGEPASVQSDLYSLGVLLYHLGTGSFPVAGRSLTELRTEHSGQTRPLTLPSHLPARLRRGIAGLLASDPARRFASADEAASVFAPRAGSRDVALAAVIVTVVGIVAWLSSGGGVRRDPNVGQSLVQLAPTLAQQYGLSGASPDGRWIACGTSDGGVALCDLEKGTARTLKSATKTEQGPSGRWRLLSPNGQSVAFGWDETIADRQVIQTVRVIDSDGDRERELVRSPPGTELSLINWSADGQSIYVGETDKSGESQLRRVSIDGRGTSEVALLGATFDIADVSPDGRLLALVRELGPNDHDVIVSDLASGREVSRLAGPFDDTSPLWLPNGGGLVFTSNRATGSSLMRVAVSRDGQLGEPSLIRAFGRERIRPHGVAPDGSIYFTVTAPARTVMVADVDLNRNIVSPDRPLDLQTVEETLGADWSADGRVAYVRVRNSGSPGQQITVVVRAGSGGVVSEIPLPRWAPQMATHVRWSPAGQSLAVVSGGNKKENFLEIVGVPRGEPRIVARGRPLSPRWDRLSGQLFYRAGGRILRVDPHREASPIEVYRQANGLLSVFDVSPSDGALAVVELDHDLQNPRCVLRIVPRTGAARDRQRFAGACHAVGWTPDGRRIAVSTLDDNSLSSLWILPVAGGDPVRLPIEADLFHNFAFSPDGRQLLYTTGNPRPALWRLRDGRP